MSDFELIPFSSNHIQQSVVLFNAEFGKDYVIESQLNLNLESDNFLGYTIIDNHSKDVIGVCLGFTSYTPEVAFKLNPSKKYVYLKSIVVKRDFHGIGLGSQLLNKFIEISLSIKQGVFSTVWINKNNTSAFEQMLKKACFVKHSEHLNYWMERSLVEKFECKVCGNPPCTCTMRVYIKNN